MRYPSEAWYEAANVRDLDLVSYMLEDVSADELNQADDNGETPLMIMAKSGFTEAVILVLEAGADPSLENEEGQTAASLALEIGDEQLSEILSDAENSVSGGEADGIEVEVEDGGFEESSGAYLVEAKLSVPVDSVFVNSVSSDKVSLYESRFDSDGRQVLSYRVKNTSVFKEAVQKVVESFGPGSFEEDDVDQSEGADKNDDIRLLGVAESFGYTLFETEVEVQIFKEYEDSVKDLGRSKMPYEEEAFLLAVADTDEESATDWIRDATGRRVDNNSFNRNVVGIDIVLDDPELFVDDVDGDVLFQEDMTGFTLKAVVYTIRGIKKFTAFANDEGSLLSFLGELKKHFPEDVNSAVVSSVFVSKEVEWDLSQSMVPEKISVARVSDIDSLLEGIEEDL